MYKRSGVPVLQRQMSGVMQIGSILPTYVRHDYDHEV